MSLAQLLYSLCPTKLTRAIGAPSGNKSRKPASLISPTLNGHQYKKSWWSVRHQKGDFKSTDIGRQDRLLGRRKVTLPNNIFLTSSALRVASSCNSKEPSLEPLPPPNLPNNLCNPSPCWAPSPSLPEMLRRPMKNLPLGHRIWRKRYPTL